MTQDEFGVALVGAGRMGQAHMAHVSQVPWFRIRAVADVNGQVAREQAEKLGAPFWTEDFREAVSRPDVDLVYVATPANYHAPVAIAAARAGKHIFCEKPLCLSIDDGEAMVLAAAKAGVTFGVNFQQRFRKLFVTLRSLLAHGELARPAQFVQQSFAEVRPVLAMNDKNMNGGPLMDVLCHYLDIWRFLFQSEPVSVYARGGIFAEGKPRVAPIRELAVDTALVTVDFASGDVGCFHVSWGLPEGIKGGGRTYLLTPDAWSEFGVGADEVTIQRGEGRTQVLDNLQGDMLAEQAAHFAEAIRNGTRPSTTGEDALVALKVSLAALESIDTGDVVAV